MDAVLLLADGAHAVNGRLYVLGGCARAVHQGIAHHVVGKVELEYLDATSTHTYMLELWHDDGEPVVVPETGEPVRATLTAGTGIPPNHPVGMPLDVMFAVPGAPASVMEPGTYEWRLTIDGVEKPAATLKFSVLPPVPTTLAA